MSRIRLHKVATPSAPATGAGEIFLDTADGQLKFIDDAGVVHTLELSYTPENVANKDTDGTLAANSDTKYASQKATKTYVDTGLAAKPTATLDTDGTLAANSDTRVPSQKAVKTYVDAFKALFGTIANIVYTTGVQTLVNKILTLPQIASLTPDGIQTITFQAATYTVIGVDTTDTLKHKTIDTAATPGNVIKINGNTLSATAGSATVTIPNATDTLVGRDTTDTLTNKTLTTPTITKPVMDATNPSAQSYTPSGGGTATLDLSLANQHRITMPAGNITIALSNATNAQIFTVSILQDGTGSRLVTWFATIRWAGGVAPTLTTTASKRDMFIFVRTGANTYDGFIVGQNI